MSSTNLNFLNVSISLQNFFDNSLFSYLKNKHFLCSMSLWCAHVIGWKLKDCLNIIYFHDTWNIIASCLNCLNKHFEQKYNTGVKTRSQLKVVLCSIHCVWLVKTDQCKEKSVIKLNCFHFWNYRSHKSSRVPNFTDQIHVSPIK